IRVVPVPMPASRICASWCFAAAAPAALHSSPTRRSSDLEAPAPSAPLRETAEPAPVPPVLMPSLLTTAAPLQAPPQVETPVVERSEEHTSELQSRENLVCRLLLEKKNRGPRALDYRRRCS